MDKHTNKPLNASANHHALHRAPPTLTFVLLIA